MRTQSKYIKTAIICMIAFSLCGCSGGNGNEIEQEVVENAEMLMKVDTVAETVSNVVSAYGKELYSMTTGSLTEDGYSKNVSVVIESDGTSEDGTVWKTYVNLYYLNDNVANKMVAVVLKGADEEEIVGKLLSEFFGDTVAEKWKTMENQSEIVIDDKVHIKKVEEEEKTTIYVDVDRQASTDITVSDRVNTSLNNIEYIDGGIMSDGTLGNLQKMFGSSSNVTIKQFNTAEQKDASTELTQVELIYNIEVDGSSLDIKSVITNTNGVEIIDTSTCTAYYDTKDELLKAANSILDELAGIKLASVDSIAESNSVKTEDNKEVAVSLNEENGKQSVAIKVSQTRGLFE